MKPWWVYVLVSEHPEFAGRTYVGASVDPDRRLRQHNGSIKGGARATRGFRPWRLARRIGPFETQREALKEERRVKKLRKRRLFG